jgi:hypothetical protein
MPMPSEYMLIPKCKEKGKGKVSEGIKGRMHPNTRSSLLSITPALIGYTIRTMIVCHDVPLLIPDDP